jgi:hypothetical protein
MVDIRKNDELLAGIVSASQEKVSVLENRVSDLTNVVNALRNQHEQILTDWVESIDSQIDLFKRLTGRDFESKHVNSFSLDDEIKDEIILDVQNNFNDYDFEQVVEAELSIDQNNINCSIEIEKNVSDYERDDLVARICEEMISQLKEKGVFRA